MGTKSSKPVEGENDGTTRYNKVDIYGSNIRQKIDSGELRITDTQLIFSGSKASFQWPIKDLKRFGSAKKVFSVEINEQNAQLNTREVVFKSKHAENIYENFKNKLAVLEGGGTENGQATAAADSTEPTKEVATAEPDNTETTKDIAQAASDSTETTKDTTPVPPCSTKEITNDVAPAAADSTEETKNSATVVAASSVETKNIDVAVVVTSEETNDTVTTVPSSTEEAKDVTETTDQANKCGMESKEHLQEIEKNESSKELAGNNEKEDNMPDRSLDSDKTVDQDNTQSNTVTTGVETNIAGESGPPIITVDTCEDQTPSSGSENTEAETTTAQQVETDEQESNDKREESIDGEKENPHEEEKVEEKETTDEAPPSDNVKCVDEDAT